MPIFHDPQDSPPWRTLSRQMSSDEPQKEGTTDFSSDASSLGSLSLETVLHSGTAHESISFEARPTSRDRNGLIERIKRVKSPLWQFRQDVSDLSLEPVEPAVFQSPICRSRINACDSRIATVPTAALKRRDRLLEIGRKRLRLLRKKLKTYAQPPLISFSTKHRQAWKSHDPAQRYTLETLENVRVAWRRTVHLRLPS
jgi:hypothetical protein